MEKKYNLVPNFKSTPNGKVIGRSAEAMNINRLLDAISVKATDLYHKQFHEQGCVLPEKIKNIILGIDTDKRKMLIQYFEEYNELYLLKIGKDTSEITHGRYELTKIRISSTYYKINKPLSISSKTIIWIAELLTRVVWMKVQV